jgi:hypothetical protein
VRLTAPERLALSCERYHRATIRQIREIPGRRWDTETRCWTIPFTDDAIERLRSMFGNRLRLDHALLRSTGQTEAASATVAITRPGPPVPIALVVQLDGRVEWRVKIGAQPTG